MDALIDACNHNITFFSWKQLYTHDHATRTLPLIFCIR